MKHIIKKILKEEFNDFDYFNDTEPSEFDNWLYQKDPELINTIGEFLKKYENLIPLVRGERTFYFNSKNKPIFYFYQDENQDENQDEKNSDCYFKYGGFWEVFEEGYGMGYDEIQEVLKVWLGITHGLWELTPCALENA